MQLTDKKTITVSEIIVKIFEKLGINTIFGYPGSSVLALYDALSLSSKINHYLLRHEQSAVHAADGYARAGGKCGVVIVTAGPGASNTITGIANAYFDGSPLIVIAGQVNSDEKGRDAFQEINFIDMVKPCVKSALRIDKPEEVEISLLEAFLLATKGKKGPVVIEIPKDILESHIEYRNLDLPEDNHFSLNDIDVNKVIELLKISHNPLIVSGGGVIHSEATKELQKFSNMLNIPVVSTMMGIGGFSQENHLYAGMIGTCGDEFANELLLSSDLLIVLGARFNDRVLNAFDKELVNGKNIIQVDINAKELLRNLRSDLVFNSDIRDFLNKLLDSVKDVELNSIAKSEFVKSKNIEIEKDDTLTMKKIVNKLWEYTKDSFPLISTDVGQHQIALIKNYLFNNPKRLITSGGYGTMGFGLPAAIGASIALDKHPVILFTGDGSFQMSLSELCVCSEYKIPVKILIMNNGYLGMVRELQEKYCEGRYFSTKISNPDFIMLAKSFGIEGVSVESVSELETAFAAAFNNDNPFVIDFRVKDM